MRASDHSVGFAARAREEGGPSRSDPSECPAECESDLELDGYDLDVGENVNCPECSMELKVVATTPSAWPSPTPRPDPWDGRLGVLKWARASFSSR